MNSTHFCTIHFHRWRRTWRTAARHIISGKKVGNLILAEARQGYIKIRTLQTFNLDAEQLSVEFQGNTPQDDVMERLLRARKGV